MNRQAVSETGIVAWCIRYVATFSHLAPSDVDPHRTFSELGLDSANSAQFLIALEDWIGIELYPDVLAAYPTIAELAAFLAVPRRAAG